MKKLILFSAIIMTAFASQAHSKVTVQTDTFKVWGNCGMCEKKLSIVHEIKKRLNNKINRFTFNNDVNFRHSPNSKRKL